MKIAVRRLIREERGQALVLVLILLLVGGLVIAPLLDFMGTGLKVGKEVYENKMYEVYAADAGVEDGLWQIKHDGLDGFAGYDEYGYYDYNPNYQWPYSLNESVNGYGVNVTIMNVWMPKDITAPNAATAQQIIEEGKLIITGDSSAEDSTYEIKLSYAWTCGNDRLLDVNTIGVWLPPGFEYVVGSSDLEKASGEPYYSVPVIVPYKGGYAVVWNFASVRLEDFPGSDGAPMIKSFTFEYEPEGQSLDSAVSWVDTSGVADVTYTWDADVKIYKILSVAGDCEVEAYAAKGQIRQLGSAIGGDYFATGNSLIGGNYHWPDNYHWQLRESTTATIETSDDINQGIPEDAIIEAAYLYWTGWIDWHNYDPACAEAIFYDRCSSFANWDAGDDWHRSSSFYAHHLGGGESDRLLIMKDSLPLSEYSGQTITVSWRHWEGGDLESDEDCLQYAFSGDGISWSGWNTAFCGDIGSSPTSFSDTIPDEYLTDEFKIRFRINSFDGSGWGWGGTEWCYIDDITISESCPDLKYPANPSPENLQVLVEETARVNKVLFNNEGISADTYQALHPDQFDGTGFEDTWFYTAMVDVKSLLKDEKWRENHSIDSNGAGTYTFGHYYIGEDPYADNYRVNQEDGDYSFDFYDTGGYTGYPLGTPSPYPSTTSRYTAAHAGWSLIIIYSSIETLGHQLYLYDIQSPSFDFFFGWHGNPDFDGDGEEGGTIQGFLVPDPISGEELAGRIAAFVGEGDAGYTRDSFIVNDEYLDDGTGSGDYNVWNSNSVGLTVEGVDIDRFDIPWGSPVSTGILKPGDTSVHIDVPTTGDDGFTMTYVILSFRSDTTSGGSITYLIRG